MASENKDFKQAQEAIFVPSVSVPDDAIPVQGPNFDVPTDLLTLLDGYGSIGFQATSLKQAIDVINEMRSWRLSDDPVTDDDEDLTQEARSKIKAKVMLGFTSNLVSSGLREIIRYLVQHEHVSGIVTTAGGIEEDLIKCLAPTYIAPEGRFDADGATLRKQGLNRIGNLVVPNNNYCAFEDWIMPVLDQLVLEQQTEGTVWAPSTVIDRLGREIKNEESYLYWAHKNGIPVFCPAITDGSLGDMLWSHSYRTENPLVIDLVTDIRRINDMSMYAKKAGMVILGGGVCKHQIANSMLMRNGADYAVYINTGQEFDGSDSGARPDEAISWGKIRAGAKSVKVFADATLVFPLLVAATWARDSIKPKQNGVVH